MSEGSLTPVVQLLIDVKVQRKALARTKSLGGLPYDQFCDTMCRLYQLIDLMNIEDLEELRRHARAVEKKRELKKLGYKT